MSYALYYGNDMYSKYIEGGPDDKAPEVVWNTNSIRISKKRF